MNIVRWEPLQELVTLRQAMDRLFEDSFVKAPRSTGNGEAAVPAIDVFETEDKVGIKATLPGVKPDDVNINITAEGVVIKGEVKSETETREATFVRKECHYGTFERTIGLPSGLKIDKAEANMENGVLTLEIPKAEEVKPRSVKIKAKAEQKKLGTAEAKEAKN
ncbi:MAG: Hsp20/alpha crystallin family protein [Dehalococcoidia bacterium]|nr:Hsp20/alpha crystallin family protein [Dehalococcoidia bacterium]